MGYWLGVFLTSRGEVGIEKKNKKDGGGEFAKSIEYFFIGSSRYSISSR